MAQHDYSIANQTAANLRTDLNNVLAAIVSNNSGATAPTDTFANMFWYDTSANILKMRNEADDDWISLGYIDQTADAFRILDDTQVVNTSGTQTGLLGDQATATWETGTGTTESLVSPAKIKAAIDAFTLPYEAGQATIASGGSTFADVPSGVNEIVVMLNGVSNTVNSALALRIGSGSVQTSGYLSVSTNFIGTTTNTTGFELQTHGAGSQHTFAITLSRAPGTNTWLQKHIGDNESTGQVFGSGRVTLSGTLDRVNIISKSGNFDAGSWSIRARV